VRGHRIETLEELSSTYVSAEARQIQPVVVAPFAAIPFILALIIFMHKADDYDEEDEEDYRNENNNYSKYTNDESGKNDSIGKEENSQ
jgi:hypothetical protein